MTLGIFIIEDSEKSMMMICSCMCKWLLSFAVCVGRCGSLDVCLFVFFFRCWLDYCEQISRKWKYVTKYDLKKRGCGAFS